MSEELYILKSISGKGISESTGNIETLLSEFSLYILENAVDLDLKKLKLKVKNNPKKFDHKEVDVILNWLYSRVETENFNLFEKEFIEEINKDLASFRLKLIWSIVNKKQARTFWELVQEYENIADKFYNEVYDHKDFNELLNFMATYSGLISRFLFDHYYSKEDYKEVSKNNNAMLKSLEHEDYDRFVMAKRYYDQQSIEFLQDIDGILDLVEYRKIHEHESPLIIPSYFHRFQVREDFLVQFTDLFWISLQLKSAHLDQPGKIYLIHQH